MSLAADAIDRILDRWPVARLATAGGALVPIVFARAAGRLWSPVDGKPKRGGELARVRHVIEQPRVRLLIDHYEDDWTKLWWLRIDADAELIRPADPDRHPDVAAAVAALRTKYPQYETTPLLGTPPTLLAFRITHTLTWSASPAPGAV